MHVSAITYQDKPDVPFCILHRIQALTGNKGFQRASPMLEYPSLSLPSLSSPSLSMADSKTPAGGLSVPEDEKVSSEARGSERDGASDELYIEPAKEAKLLAKLDLAFTPVIMLVYLACFLDRSNIGPSPLIFAFLPNKSKSSTWRKEVGVLSGN